MGFVKSCIVTILFICVNVVYQETVKVTLFYETLCPYSLEFINNQLYPGYQKLGDVITMDLIPFGNAKIKSKHGKVTIACQHGPKECYGNKLHACVIQNNTQNTWMSYIGCDTADDIPNDNEIAKKCAENNKLTWSKLKHCASGEEGINLLLKYGKRTEEEKVSFVPYIMFNDVFNQTLANKARDSFVEVICELFSEKPNGC